MRDDEERARNILNRLEQLLHPVIDGRGIILEHFAAVRAEEYRNGFRAALEKVAEEFAGRGREAHWGTIGMTEVQAFLDTRIVHYPEAQAIRTRTE